VGKSRDATESAPVRHVHGEEVPIAVDLQPKKKTQIPTNIGTIVFTVAASMEKTGIGWQGL
jgi:hypothetical protein